MLKHGNELDDLIDAQARAGLPHSGVIRNGKLSYGARQLSKHPGKAALLYLLLLPGVLVVALGALHRLLRGLGDTGSLMTGVTAAAVAIVYIVFVVSSFKKAKKAKQEAKLRNKQQKRRKKKRR